MANIPEFNSTPWSLPVGCYSIIIKHEAIIRSFPGGVRAFETAFQPIRKSWVLYLLMALSSEALDRLLARLGEDGLRCGFDFAVADKVRRPIAECPGVTFTDHGRHQWTVDVEEVDVRDADALIPPAAAAAFRALQEACGDQSSAEGGETPQPSKGASETALAPSRRTRVTGLSRKADRQQFLKDLQAAMEGPSLADLTIRWEDDCTTIEAYRPELSALIILTHRRRSDMPLIHWHGASRKLRHFRSAWTSVNPCHRRKATSFPQDLEEVIDCLVAGMMAASDGTAFQQEDVR